MLHTVDLNDRISVSSRIARRLLTRFAADNSGATAITLSLTFSMLVGLAALGTEVANWYVIRRTMQSSVDSAAYSAALAKGAGAASAAYTSEAQSVTAGYGFVDGQKNVTVTVNNPPSSGNYTGDNNAVEVIVSQPQTLKLAGLFMSAAPTLQARAVATRNPNGMGACVLALDHGNVTDLKDNGNTTLNLNGCDVYVNSVSDSALVLNGQAVINANRAFISGGYTTSGQAALHTSHTYTHVAAANDPYADVPVPSHSGCNENNYSLSGNNSHTFSAGTSGVMVFCNGFSLTGGSSVTFQPGTYVIDGGSFSIAGNSSISGTGVTIVLTGSSSNGYATASIAGGSVVDITAPTSGTMAGLAFYQDRNAPSSGSDSFSGGTTQNITGALYFPNQGVTFNGGTQTGAKCTQLIGYTLTFNGNANFNSDCMGTGVRPIGSAFIQLVE